MIITSILPFAAGILLFVFMTYTIFKNDVPMRNSWILPAIFSFAFLIFSLITVFLEGSMGFWVDHTRNFWGNQIWFDLLMAAGIGWFLIVPRAKAQNMRLIPWAVLVLCTGCIGFTVMVSRMLYLQEHNGIQIKN